MNPTPEQDQTFWQDRISEGESLLWTGRPGQGLRYSKGGQTLSIFGVFFTIFAFYGLSTTLHREDGGTFLLIDIMLVAGGLYLLVGHWLLDAYQRTRSRYALTDRRALIYSGLFNPQAHSYPLSGGSPIEIAGDGPYVVSFARETRRNDNFSTYKQEVAFRFIEDGPAVFDMMQSVVRKTA